MLLNMNTIIVILNNLINIKLLIFNDLIFYI